MINLKSLKLGLNENELGKNQEDFIYFGYCMKKLPFNL